MISTSNLVIDAACVAIYSILIWVGWRMYRKGDFMSCLVILLVIAALLRLYVGADLYLHEWDERYHALVAKNLMDNPLKPVLYDSPLLPYDYRDWSANHIWLHKQPFPLWCMALSMKIFGVNELALRLPSIILSTISVLGTFIIGKNIFNKNIGIIAAFLHTIHGLSIELTGGRTATDHVDVFFQGLVVFSVAFGLLHAKTKNGGWLIAMALCCGLAILTKWLPALIVLPLWIILCFKFQKFSVKEVIGYFIITIILITLVTIPWQVWIHHQYPQEYKWEQQFNIRHLVESIEGHGQPFYYYLNKIRIIYGELIYLPLLWFVIVWMRKKMWSHWLLGVWIFAPLLFFSIATTKMPAYLQISASAFFLLTAYFIQYCLYIKKNTQYPLLVYIIIAGLVLLPVRYMFERVKFFSTKERSPQWVEKLKELSWEMKDGKQYILFGEERPIEAMFYCKSLTAYSIIPDSNTINSLLKKKYIIFIKNNKKQVYEKIDHGL